MSLVIFTKKTKTNEKGGNAENDQCHAKPHIVTVFILCETEQSGIATNKNKNCVGSCSYIFNRTVQCVKVSHESEISSSLFIFPPLTVKFCTSICNGPISNIAKKKNRAINATAIVRFFCVCEEGPAFLCHRTFMTSNPWALLNWCNRNPDVKIT